MSVIPTGESQLDGFTNFIESLASPLTLIIDLEGSVSKIVFKLASILQLKHAGPICK